MDEFPKGILLATDGSEEAILAARAAADLSARSDSELHVVHVWHDVHTTHFHGYVKRELHEWGQEILDEQVEKLEEMGAAVAGAHLRMGNTVEEVVGLARRLGVGLIVTGSRRLGLMGRLVMGSVSEGIVHHAPCPVLVVRGEEAWPPGRIILADDSFDAAGREADPAAKLARILGAEVTLVRAYQGLLADSRRGRDVAVRMAEDTLRHEEDAVRGRADDLEELLGKRPGVRAFAGDPVTSVAQVVGEEEKPALVAVGYARQHPSRISDKIMRAAHGPVLVSPTPEAARPDEVKNDVGVSLLVATDGSEPSFYAGERAVRLAGSLGARLHVLYVVDHDGAFHAGVHYGDAVRELARAGREATGRISALARQEGVAHQELVAEGRPAEVIVGTAREVGADYILMGAEGMSRVGRALVGSVSQEVLRHADRPVLLVGGRRLPDDPLLSRRFRLTPEAGDQEAPEKSAQ